MGCVSGKKKVKDPFPEYTDEVRLKLVDLAACPYIKKSTKSVLENLLNDFMEDDVEDRDDKAMKDQAKTHTKNKDLLMASCVNFKREYKMEIDHVMEEHEDEEPDEIHKKCLDEGKVVKVKNQFDTILGGHEEFVTKMIKEMRTFLMKKHKADLVKIRAGLAKKMGVSINEDVKKDDEEDEASEKEESEAAGSEASD